jgi:hypothetical protein
LTESRHRARPHGGSARIPGEAPLARVPDLPHTKKSTCIWLVARPGGLDDIHRYQVSPKERSYLKCTLKPLLRTAASSETAALTMATSNRAIAGRGLS